MKYQHKVKHAVKMFEWVLLTDTHGRLMPKKTFLDSGAAHYLEAHTLSRKREGVGPNRSHVARARSIFLIDISAPGALQTRTLTYKNA